MKIGDYEQMMSYLTRKSFKEGTPDTSKPKPKPLTEDFFKEKADLYIKGLIGGFPQDEMLLKLQGILDKAVEQGIVKPEEGIDYFRNRKQELLDFVKENPGETLPSLNREEFKDGTPGKSAFRKPFPPEIEKQIIKLHQVDKMGAQAIADELGLSRSPVGKRITALKKEGKIKDIPYAERKASIDQRGDLFGKPPKEKYLTVREIRDVDRKAVDKSTGKSLYNIPEKAKFKVNFGNTGARFTDITNVPEEFIGVKYFNTKEAAEKALAKRKKLKLIGDEDPDPIRRKANKKKYDLVKEVSDNNIERVLADFKKGQPLEQAHRLSLNQVKKTGEMYNVMNLGLDFDDPKLVQINNELVKPYENKLKQLYTEQNKLYKKASNLKTIPKELQKQIEFNNLKISSVVDLAGGRVQGLQLDEITLKPKVTGVNYANVLGFGIYDKPVKELTDVDRAGIGAVMQGQIENEKRTAGKTAEKLFQNKQFLKDVDKLAVQSMVPGMTTADQIKDFQIRTGGPTLGAVGDIGMARDILSRDIETGKRLISEYGPKVLQGARQVGKFAVLPELALGAAFAPLDLGEGRSGLETLLNVATLGMGVPISDARDRANYVDQFGLKEDLFSAQIKQSGAQYGAPELTEREKLALEKAQEFDTEVLQPRLEKTLRERQAASDPNFGTGIMGMANGGRIGFADGYDPKRRKFMKTAAGIASIPVFGRMLKPVVKGMEAAGPAVTQAATEAEKIFFKLVDAVKNKGIMDKLDKVTGGRLSGAYHKYKDAEVLEDAGSITAKFKTDKGAPAEIVYVKPQKGIDPKTGKEVEYPGQFDYEAQEIARINPEGDVDIDAEFEIIDSIEDVKKLIDD